jgi:hypothetical protein
VRRLIAAEWFKIRHHKSLPILVAFAAAFAAVQTHERTVAEGVISGQLGVTALASVSPLNGILLAAFVGFFVAAEFDNGGVRNSLALGKDRLLLYLSKQASVFAALAAILLASSVAATMVGTMRLGFGDMDAAGYLGFLCTIFALQWLYHAVYAALFAAIAFIARSPALTVLLSIGAIIFETVFMAFLGYFDGFAQSVQSVLPSYNIRLAFFGHTDPAFLTHSVTASVAAILLLCAVGAWAFGRAEIR